MGGGAEVVVADAGEIVAAGRRGAGGVTGAPFAEGKVEPVGAGAEVAGADAGGAEAAGDGGFAFGSGFFAAAGSASGSRTSIETT